LLFATVLVVGSSGRRAAASSGDNEEARRHFAAGVSYLEDQEGERFEDAYGEFKKAYEISHSPKVLGNLGLCAMKLERDDEAIDDYTRYLAEVPDIDPTEKAQITRDLQNLMVSAVTATVTTGIPAATIVDTRLPVRGSSVTNVYDVTGGAAKLRVRPGHHVMHLRIAGREVSDWDFVAEAGAQITHAFETAPARTTAPRSGIGAGPILTIGLGAAALAVGGVLGMATLEKVHTLEGECPNNACPSSVYSHDLSSTRTFTTATDITLLAGGVVAAGGVAWLILSVPHAVEPSPVQVGGGCRGAGCYATVRFGF
jgi:hypothetical protein